MDISKSSTGFEIARLTQQPIKKMRLNTNGVFEEVKNPFCNHDLDQ